MATLQNLTQDKKLQGNLKIAKSFWSRSKGLLGTRTLSDDEALWIHACNSIHTFFMSYPIDCVFLDSELCVKSLVTNVMPGRIVWPKWGANSVIEMKSGSIKRFGLRLGDRLDVGS